MYERWCDVCEKPMKCKQVRENLYCIGCKRVLDQVGHPAEAA